MMTEKQQQTTISKEQVSPESTASIILYTSEDGQTQIEVKLQEETVWLTTSQMADLFCRDRTVISRHIRNCFKEGELAPSITCAKFAHMGTDGDQVYETTMYNLDVIISVGYRIKSVNGTRFRQWANRVLKEYLIKGYVVNQNLKIERYNELKHVVQLMSRALSLQEDVTNSEYGGLFNVISDYVYALNTLDRYDYQSLSIDKTTSEEPFRATYENAMVAINALKEKFGGSQWFANEKDDSFRSSVFS